MTPKRALVTGVSGQLGSHLADLLLAKGYEVHGSIRPTSNLSRLEHLTQNKKFALHFSSGPFFSFLLEKVKPDEVYNLAAPSSVAASWGSPVESGDAAGLDVARLLEAVRGTCPNAKIYQASTSEMFGAATQSPQNEDTAFRPKSPYACAKAYGHHIAVNFRESYGLFVVSGISFNAEGPRRGEQFVTRKITLAAAKIHRARKTRLVLGNLEARRDWGFAPEYAEAMWLTLQQQDPRDYVIATGIQHSVEDFCRVAFEHVGLDWAQYVEVDPLLRRPVEPAALVGDASKIYKHCGWRSRTSFPELVKTMVDADLAKEP